LFDLNIRPKNMSVEELQSGFLKLVSALYSTEETRSRRRALKRWLKQSPALERTRAATATLEAVAA
jgi:hypothetical protein